PAPSPSPPPRPPRPARRPLAPVPSPGRAPEPLRAPAIRPRPAGAPTLRATWPTRSGPRRVSTSSRHLRSRFPPASSPGLRSGLVLAHHRGPVAEDLRGGRRDHRRREADADDRVRAELFGLLDHPVDRLLAGLGHELRVLADLSPRQVPEPGQDVAPHVPCPDRVPPHQPQDAYDPLPGQHIRRHYDHRSRSL